MVMDTGANLGAPSDEHAHVPTGYFVDGVLEDEAPESSRYRPLPSRPQMVVSQTDGFCSFSLHEPAQWEMSEETLAKNLRKNRPRFPSL